MRSRCSTETSSSSRRCGAAPSRSTTTRSFGELDHTILTHPLAHYDGDTDALTGRVGELHAMGFRRMLLTLPSDTSDVQWATLESLHEVARAFL
jgi:hypothetical protein